MEYLVGSIFTIIILIGARSIINKSINNIKIPVVRRTQSQIFEMVKPFLVFSSLLKPRRETQTSVFDQKRHVKVIISEQKAYWILNNVFYEAEEMGGIINKESAKPVDTMHMDKVQLDKMTRIVEILTEGVGDEDWNSRN
jgi:hypothetical protein